MCATKRLLGLCDLDTQHQEIFRKALSNLLSTELAERTFAQILDGLPTLESADDSFIVLGGHPIREINHIEICDGFLEKARQFRSEFDPSTLDFDLLPLEAFQKTTPNTKEFNLRLIWLLVVACHQIAAYLYELDDGAHKHEVIKRWVEDRRSQGVNGQDPSGYYFPPIAFFHVEYTHSEQYPRGLADVAGYWAEGRIFGGVVVFDRGETDQECKEMWIHGLSSHGPETLYPPRPEEFDLLINFLLSEPADHLPCPLPIKATPNHRPRWDPYQAIAHYHIFRDRYERIIPDNPPVQSSVRQSILNWPELWDDIFLYRQSIGEDPPDEEEVAAVHARRHLVTRSSPRWRLARDT
ncbi:hypothetical protein BGZ63DRAFT_390730 [Mariannaea sp. PMI_226]|nr:hypothetical protein BGZ63DRAFT_390730 [Mariannaea sp. PMI_226]